MNSPTEHKHTPSVLAVIGWLALASGSAFGFWTLDQKLKQPAAVVDLGAVEAALLEQAKEITALRAAFENQAMSPTMDDSAIELIRNELADLREEIKAQQRTATTVTPAQSTARMVLALSRNIYRNLPYAQELEAIASLEVAKPAMPTIDILRVHADKGLPSDHSLRAEFAQIARAQTASHAAPQSAMLGGLITIKRQPAAPQLSSAPAADAPIAEYAAYVRALPESEQAAYAAWLAALASREAVHTALEQLHNQLLPAG